MACRCPRESERILGYHGEGWVLVCKLMEPFYGIEGRKVHELGKCDKYMNREQCERELAEGRIIREENTVIEKYKQIMKKRRRKNKMAEKEQQKSPIQCNEISKNVDFSQEEFRRTWRYKVWGI